MSLDVGLDVDRLLERVEAAAQEYGYRVEITESGAVHATMSPSQKHAVDGRRLAHWLEQFVHNPVRVLETGHIATVGYGRREPDIKVLAVDPELLPNDAWATPASFIILAVEINSPTNQDNDWEAKMAAYAASGIRYYWIVDLDRVVHFYALPAARAAVAYVAIGSMPLDELLASGDLPAGVVL